MCGRIVWRWDPEMQAWVKEWLDDGAAAAVTTEPWAITSRYNVAPTEAVVVALVAGGRHALRPFRWGFPHEEGTACNTRIENAFTSPLWRGAAGERHCIVPVTGFYEWLGAAGRKVPHFFFRRDGRPLLLAGVWAPRSVPGQGVRDCVSIVTCPAEGVVAEVHDRMPLHLDPVQVDEWLAVADAPAAGRLRPPRDALAGHQVSQDVNTSSTEGPRLIAPARQWF